MVPVHRLRWSKLRKCDGAAMVEFAIGSTVLIMFVLGVFEFGFLWYQQQVITNAAREAARYGITYQTDVNGNRVAPKNITTPYTIQQVVTNYVTNRNIPTCTITVADGTPAGGYTLGTKGSPIVVTVTCVNTMDLLSGFIPSLKNMTFKAQSIMNCE
ncbi:MAG: TadE/TadG family type IV pilus assembly protein [Desulfobaccales bacterium]